MPSTASATYQGNIEGKLITAISTTTTTGVTVKIKQVNGSNPTWPTAAHRLRITQKTATVTKVEEVGVAAGTTQSGQTVTLGTLTRALPLSDGTDFTGSGTAQSFSAGADVFFAWDEHDAAQSLKADIVNTITGAGAIRGSSTTVAAFRPNSMTTSQRDAIAAPGNGDIIYNSTTSVLNQYIGGAWTTFATGTTGNAADGTGGKVDLATTTEIAALTANDASSGSPNALSVSVVSITTATSGKIAALNSAGKLDVAIGGTGVASPTSGNLLLGAGTSAMTLLAPSTTGNVVTSNGSTFTSAAPVYYHKTVFASGANSTAVGVSSTAVNTFDTHTYTIPANDLAAGVGYEFEGVVDVTWVAGDMTFSPQLGSTNFNAFGSGDITPTGSAGLFFKGFIMGTAAAGASVAVRCAVSYQFSGSSALKGAASYNTQNVATNGTLALQFAIKYFTSNGGHTSTMRMSRMSKVSSTSFT